MVKNSRDMRNTSSCLKVKGTFVRYAKPVVEKTSYKRLLKAALSSDERSEGESRCPTSTMGSEENAVVIS